MTQTGEQTQARKQPKWPQFALVQTDASSAWIDQGGYADVSGALDEAYDLYKERHDDSLLSVIQIEHDGNVVLVMNARQIEDYCVEREDEEQRDAGRGVTVDMTGQISYGS